MCHIVIGKRSFGLIFAIICWILAGESVDLCIGTTKFQQESGLHCLPLIAHADT